MLNLKRRVQERIVIGDDIVIEVREVKNGRVLLGIAAPPGVRVDREERRAARPAGPAAGDGGGR